MAPGRGRVPLPGAAGSGGGLELNPGAPTFVCWAVGAPCCSFSGLLEGIRAVVSTGREAELRFAAWLSRPPAPHAPREPGTGCGCWAGLQALHLCASVSLLGKAAVGCAMASSASEWLVRALCSRAAHRERSLLLLGRFPSWEQSRFLQRAAGVCSLPMGGAEAKLAGSHLAHPAARPGCSQGAVQRDAGAAGAGAAPRPGALGCRSCCAELAQALQPVPRRNTVLGRGATQELQSQHPGCCSRLSVQS